MVEVENAKERAINIHVNKALTHQILGLADERVHDIDHAHSNEGCV